jgi:hypothetical protein
MLSFVLQERHTFSQVFAGVDAAPNNIAAGGFEVTFAAVERLQYHILSFAGLTFLHGS